MRATSLLSLPLLAVVLHTLCCSTSAMSYSAMMTILQTNDLYWLATQDARFSFVLDWAKGNMGAFANLWQSGSFSAKSSVVAASCKRAPKSCAVNKTKLAAQLTAAGIPIPTNAYSYQDYSYQPYNSFSQSGDQGQDYSYNYNNMYGNRFPCGSPYQQRSTSFSGYDQGQGFSYNNYNPAQSQSNYPDQLSVDFDATGDWPL